MTVVGAISLEHHRLPIEVFTLEVVARLIGVVMVVSVMIAGAIHIYFTRAGTYDLLEGKEG